MNQGIDKWGWKENPFILKIDPSLFVGYEEQVRAALKHIENRHKVALITGNTGSGKTTFLKWLEKRITILQSYMLASLLQIRMTLWGFYRHIRRQLL
jgi:type II secretory pathway predicted ATPase ExeA